MTAKGVKIKRGEYFLVYSIIDRCKTQYTCKPTQLFHLARSKACCFELKTDVYSMKRNKANVFMHIFKYAKISTTFSFKMVNFVPVGLYFDGLKSVYQN